MADIYLFWKNHPQFICIRAADLVHKMWRTVQLQYSRPDTHRLVRVKWFGGTVTNFFSNIGLFLISSFVFFTVDIRIFNFSVDYVQLFYSMWYLTKMLYFYFWSNKNREYKYYHLQYYTNIGIMSILSPTILYKFRYDVNTIIYNTIQV